MSLLDRVVGQVSEALSGAQHEGIGTATLDLLNSPQVGGIQGLAALLEQKGLGNVVQSWIGTGANLPISGEQLKAALGSDSFVALAQKAGVSPDQAQQALSQLLPSLVDKLTPGGQIPPGPNLAQAGLSVLKSILG
jgi:uncharacterized protein YidB (DUF937 family)